MKNKIVIGAVITALIVIGSYYFISSGKESTDESGKSYTFADVSKGDIVVDIIADGQIEIPIRNYNFDLSGKIMNVNVSLNQRVKKGEELISIDSTDLIASLNDAKLNLNNAILTKEKNENEFSKNTTNYKYQLNKFINIYQMNKKNLENMKNLSSSYSQNEIDIAENNYNLSLEEYENYKIVNKPISTLTSDNIAINKADNTVKKLENDLKDNTLTALKSGKVIEINSDINESVNNSDVVMKIEEDGKTYVTTEVQEIDISSVSIGQKAYIEIEALSDKKFVAKVTEIDRDPIVDSNGIVNYKVTLLLDENDENIMDGMTSTVSFILLEKLGVIKIPNKAVKKVGSKQVVIVSTGEGTGEERVIVTGLTDGKYVEVIKGIEVGQKLIY
ncbi:efflux RND transporter periplasmic adaptor subunit [Helicovermis profundi]|uniref:Efflux RND transporter periplasmic adaptor subunit n=1 Tax=Helicovermis profundi TaxID=3065157 RepID=A0AAU9E225_9FIRM|nr:efflux RND transporter periplasmic adaptor subunit [Clostridia bacterium S502]